MDVCGGETLSGQDCQRSHWLRSCCGKCHSHCSCVKKCIQDEKFNLKKQLDARIALQEERREALMLEKINLTLEKSNLIFKQNLKSLQEFITAYHWHKENIDTIYSINDSLIDVLVKLKHTFNETLRRKVKKAIDLCTEILVDYYAEESVLDKLNELLDLLVKLTL